MSPKILAIPFLLILLAMPVLGAIAVAQIRNSGGKLRGLGLAVFDLLLVPLLALDGLIFAVCSLLLNGNSSFQSSTPAAIMTAILSIPIDALIAAWAWRKLSRMPGAPMRPPMPGSSPVGYLALGLALLAFLGTPLLLALVNPSSQDYIAVFAIISVLLGILTGLFSRTRLGWGVALSCTVIICSLMVFFVVRNRQFKERAQTDMANWRVQASSSEKTHRHVLRRKDADTLLQQAKTELEFISNQQQFSADDLVRVNTTLSGLDAVSKDLQDDTDLESTSRVALMKNTRALILKAMMEKGMAPAGSAPAQESTQSNPDSTVEFAGAAWAEDVDNHPNDYQKYIFGSQLKNPGLHQPVLFPPMNAQELKYAKGHKVGSGISLGEANEEENIRVKALGFDQPPRWLYLWFYDRQFKVSGSYEVSLTDDFGAQLTSPDDNANGSSSGVAGSGDGNTQGGWLLARIYVGRNGKIPSSIRVRLSRTPGFTIAARTDTLVFPLALSNDTEKSHPAPGDETATNSHSIPQLRFLVWHDGNTNDDLLNWRAWHRNSTPVQDPDELKLMRDKQTQLLSTFRPEALKENYLWVWFQLPGLGKESAIKEIVITDLDGKQLSMGRSGTHFSWDGEWLVTAFKADVSASVPPAAIFQVKYIADPWKTLIDNILPNPSQTPQLAGDIIPGSSGQTAEGRAFMSFFLSGTGEPAMDYDFHAVTKDHRELRTEESHGGSKDNIGILTAEFDVKLDQIDHFVLLGRPIRTAGFNNVRLSPPTKNAQPTQATTNAAALENLKATSEVLQESITQKTNSGLSPSHPAVMKVLQQKEAVLLQINELTANPQESPELAKAKADLALATRTYGPGHPEVMALQKRVGELQPQEPASGGTPPPVLRFLAWMDESTKNEPQGWLAWHRDGSMVQDEAEQRWMERLQHEDPLQSNPDLHERGYLCLWITGPQIENGSSARIAVYDPAGSEIPFENTKIAMAASGPEGCITFVGVAKLQPALPSWVNITCLYAGGPWKDGIEIPSDTKEKVALDKQASLDEVGEFPNGHAFVRWRNVYKAPSSQYYFVAVTKDGRVVERNGSNGTYMTEPDEHIETNEFPLKLSEIKAFRAMIRPVRKVQYANVPLRPSGAHTAYAPQPQSTPAAASPIPAQVVPQEAKPFAVEGKLPQGSLTLAAVSQHPSEGAQWWAPDGSPAKEGPFKNPVSARFPNPGEQAREFVFHAKDLPKDVSVLQWQFLHSHEGSEGGEPPLFKGSPAQGYYLVSASLPPAMRTVDIRAGFAMGPWETIDEFDNPGHYRNTTQHGSLGWQLVSNQVLVTNEDQSVAFYLYYDVIKTDDGTYAEGWNPDTRNTEETRAVAIDDKGKEHTGIPTKTYSPTSPSVKLVTTFLDVPAARIKKIRIEARPTQWMEFRNVALQPVAADEGQASATQPRTYTSSAIIEIKSSSLQTASPRPAADAAGIIRSHAILDSVIDEQGLVNKWSTARTKLSKEDAYQKLVKMVAVTPKPNTDLFIIAVTSQDPQEAADIANAVALASQKKWMKDQEQAIASTLAQFNTEIEKQKKVVEQAAAELAKMRTRDKIDDPHPDNSSMQVTPRNPDYETAKQNYINNKKVLEAAQQRFETEKMSMKIMFTPLKIWERAEPSSPNSTANAATPAPGPKTTKESTGATRENPFVNSLGMKFVPVPGTKVLFGIWDTRVRDFLAYEDVNPGADESWKNPGFKQGNDEPVCNVSWNEAKAFCAWLTQQDRKEGKIGTEQEYRLPTDTEWSVAAGDGKYPWGDQWPPSKDAGNYNFIPKPVAYEKTSPVGSFAANQLGLYDMGGNVWQWCEDFYRSEMNDTAYLQKYAFLKDDGGGEKYRVVRGSCCNNGNDPVDLMSSRRNNGDPDRHEVTYGFRCVLTTGTGQATSAAPQAGQVVISVAANGSFFMNKKEIDAAALKAQLTELAGKNPDQPVILRADAKADYKYVTAMLDICKEAGIKNSAFATASESIPAGTQVTELKSLPDGNVYVFGEVKNPGMQSIPAGGKLTASQAVLTAGGPTPQAALRKAKVFRKIPDGSGRTYELDLKEVLESGKFAHDMDLQQGDYIYIPKSLIDFE